MLNSPFPSEKELADLTMDIKTMSETPRQAGYVFCDICGKYDEDAGGIDYWTYKGKIWCYGGCWLKLQRDTEARIEELNSILIAKNTK